MIWRLALSVSLITFLCSVIIVVLNAIILKNGSKPNPLNIIMMGMFIAVVIALLPVYNLLVSDTQTKALKVIFLSVLNTFQVFTVNMDGDVILDNINNTSTDIADVYSTYMSVIFVIAPILTFGFLISFFKNVSSCIKYLLHYFDDIYVFSELNEKSIALGKDIEKNHKKSLLVYANVILNDDEKINEALNKVKSFGGICFKDSASLLNFRFHLAKAKLSFFEIAEDETENIQESLEIIEKYRRRGNTDLYVFSKQIEGELILLNCDFGKMRVRRINDVNSLINSILLEDGNSLFDNALKVYENEKHISALIVGLGTHGKEMLKALTWYCQMDGYKFYLDAFDIDENANDKFFAMCPELLSDKYNGVSIPNEAEYTINIHSGYDVESKSFVDEIYKLTETTYVFVSLGSDEMNIRTAVNLRMIFERMGIHPKIQTVVYNSDEKKLLKDIKNFKGQAYDIDFTGDLETSYSESVIINSILEAQALRLHRKWGNEDEFWAFEYNYRSSVASALHINARIHCGIAGADKAEGELSEIERATIEKIEHRRWNAYMRAQGYIYSGSTDKASRNDLAKMHHDLVDYEALSDKEKRKDSSVGTI